MAKKVTKNKTTHKHKESKTHKAKKHPTTKRHTKKESKFVKNYALGATVFIVLVAIVYGLIVLVSDFGMGKDSVAATVNGEVITMDNLEEQYSRVPPMYQQFISKETLLNQSINELLLLQEAKKMGVMITEQEVQAEIALALQKGGISIDELDARLQEQNLTRALLEEMYTKQLTINKLLDAKLFDKIEVSQQDALDFYDSRIHAMHVLVEDEDTAYEVTSQLRRVSRNNLESKFGELAGQYSTDPSAATNMGDLGEFSQGQMVPEFEAAAFALAEYEYTTEPVKTSFGFHVILRLPKENSFENSQEEIVNTLKTQEKANLVPGYVEELLKTSDIQIKYKDSE